MHLEVDGLDLYQGDEIDQSHACFGTCGKLLELLVGAEQEDSVRNDSDCVRKKLSSSFLPQSPKSATGLCRAA